MSAQKIAPRQTTPYQLIIPLFVILFGFIHQLLGPIAYADPGESGGSAHQQEETACPSEPFARYIIAAPKVENADAALCAPNGQPASVGDKNEIISLDAFLILDMGAGNEIIPGPGADFIFYESPNADFGGNILLDRVIIDISDNSPDNPDSFTEVFVWGDSSTENNGSLRDLVTYLPEDPGREIRTSDLVNGNGIAIDIGDDSTKRYQYIRFRPYPSTPEELANRRV